MSSSFIVCTRLRLRDHSAVLLVGYGGERIHAINVLELHAKFGRKQ